MRSGALLVSVTAASHAVRPENNNVVTRTTRRTLSARGIPAIENCSLLRSHNGVATALLQRGLDSR